MSENYQIYGGINVGNIFNSLVGRNNINGENLRGVLSQLQEAIEEDTDLSPDDKADLLEQLRTLAEAKRIPEVKEKQALVRKASKIFEATLKDLSDNANIVEAYNKFLPMILTEVLSDKMAVVMGTISPNQVGRVVFVGTYWPAKCLQNVVLEVGMRVVVIGLQNMTLLVEPVI